MAASSVHKPLPASAYHVPVMLPETIDGLQIRENGIYVDCTFGGGSHSKEILAHLGSDGKLFAFDQDADARQNLPDDKRIIFFPHNFRYLQRFLRLHKISAVDGVLADLGVSSHQLDEAARGFSLRLDGNLDMRMDRRQTLTAANIIDEYSEQDLHKLFERYGEVSNAKTLAKKIIESRHSVPLKTAADLKQAIGGIVKGNPNRYFAQVFQALRIEVNDEIGALKEMLQQAVLLLKPGGRIVVISFHSLEDRIVKHFFKNGSFDETGPSDPFGLTTVSKTLRVITKKPLLPTVVEINQNQRSRSAKLRIAEKI